MLNLTHPRLRCPVSGLGEGGVLVDDASGSLDPLPLGGTKKNTREVINCWLKSQWGEIGKVRLEGKVR